MRTQVRSLASLSGLRIRRCRGLGCRLQMWLDLASLWLWCRLAAVAPHLALSLETSICHECSPKKTKKQKKKQKKKQSILSYSIWGIYLIGTLHLLLLRYSLACSPAAFRRCQLYLIVPRVHGSLWRSVLFHCSFPSKIRHCFHHYIFAECLVRQILPSFCSFLKTLEIPNKT